MVVASGTHVEGNDQRGTAVTGKAKVVPRLGQLDLS